MSLSPGTRFGSYEVADQIGVGGMGEVYRARDIKLNRDVALKVLPDSFASDPDRLARFQREAHVLASLNHPNIAAIYGVEEVAHVRALVMELVDGSTLAELMTRASAGGAARALDVDDALRVATQISDALGAAHDQGVIHRDLKPANIKVKTDGTVKVLDFGLAKAIGSPDASSVGPNFSSSNPVALSQSPTITTPAMTQIGVLLGTAAYMSPEQAKGRPADTRSDVWAFGCVFYEMLTGHRAFAEDDVSETLAAVLKSEPDWTRFPADVPPSVRTLIRRCLVKDRRQRVADMSTATFVLRELGNLEARPATATVPASSRSRSQRLLPPLAAATVTAAIVSAGAWALRPAVRPPMVAQFSFNLPDGDVLSGTRQAIAISPDGTRIAYAANSRIYLRSIGELATRAIPGAENPAVLGLLNPIFGPDGQSIAYFSQSDGTNSTQTSFVLKRIAIGGGTPSTIGTMNSLFGAFWDADGFLIGQLGGVMRVSLSGGMERIAQAAPDERVHGPQLLPGGKTLLFTVLGASTLPAVDWDKAQIVAQSLSDGTRTMLVDGGSDARYLSSGHLVYAVAGTVYAAPLDISTLTLTHPPVPVIPGVRRVAARRASAGRQFAVSETGTLAYMPGPATTSGTTTLVVGDSLVSPGFLKVEPAEYVHPRVSPDGRMVAVARVVGQESDISTYELSGASEMRRLTFGGNNSFPVWSGDSKRIAFQSARDGRRAIFVQSADGKNTPEPLTDPAQGEEHRPESWSRDGSHLLFSILKDSKFTLWVLTLATKKSEPFGQVESAEPLSASFSPKGQWVVYASTPVAGGIMSTNRGIFVQPFPATGELHQVPRKFLDFHPVWTPDGKSIYYVAGATRPTVLVSVTTSPAVAFGSPVDLPRGPQPGLLSGDVRGYDILPDGRFLSLAPAPGEGSEFTSNVEIRVVMNWFEELKRLSPVQ